MKIRKLLKRDLFLGWYYNFSAYIIPIIIAIAQGIECHKLINYMNSIDVMDGNGTIFDYYLFGVQGMRVFHFNPKEYFTIPIYWFVFQICIAYIIGYYSHQDFIQNGRNLFVKLKDRDSWWKSKCLWCICNVLLYYVIYILTTCVTAFFFGAKWKVAVSDFVTDYFGNQIGNMQIQKLLFVSLIVPCIITIALSLVQILAGFLLTPVVSFACVCGLYVVSAYYTEWPLVGNYTMWIRTKWITPDGVHPISGFILAFVLIICAWNAGEYYFSKKDLF